MIGRLLRGVLLALFAAFFLVPLVALADFSTKKPAGGRTGAAWHALISDPTLTAAVRVSVTLAVLTALGMLVLTYGWVLPAAVLVALLVLAVVRRDGRAAMLLLVVSLPLAALICAAWVVALHVLMPQEAGAQLSLWMSWNIYQLNRPTLATLAFLGKYGVWFAWPAWPFAGWALYAWRRQLRSLHIALPLAFLIPVTLLVLINVHTEEGMLLPLLPALAMLAAFGLPTMKRGAINAVDWFSVMTLTTSAAFIWIGWIAKETGWPAQIARNAYKLAPGFKPGFAWISLAIAIAATIAWIIVVHWRISRRPSVLWRAVVLSSGGVILCWVLLMTLWLPWVNYGKSYAGVAEQIESKLTSVKQCVQSNVGPAQRASFAYFGNVRFADERDQTCDYLLLQDDISNQDAAIMLRPYPGSWRMVWEGRRPSDRDERFRLYRRIGG